MELSNVELWNKYRAENTDFYGKGVLDYAERWGDTMDAAMSAEPEGDFGGMAERTSHEADIDGITGFMYGMAVKILAEVWVHGEQLRQWHNLARQIGNEGELANKNGGTLNPAILSFVVEPDDN